MSTLDSIKMHSMSIMEKKTELAHWMKPGLFLVGILLLLSCALLALVSIAVHPPSDFFVELARSFLDGRLDLMHSGVLRNDVAAFNGKAYLPLGPFPALLLTPVVVLFGTYASVGLLSLPVVLGVLYCVYRLARRVGFSFDDGVWLACALAFASPFVSVVWVPLSWQFAHQVTVLMLLLALLEYFGKRRWMVIGLLYAGIVATRAPAVLTILFFVAHLVIAHRKKYLDAATYAFELLLPVGVAVALLMIYNYLRFENIFEVGYSLANLGPDLVSAREHGVLSLKHLPGNLYYFLIAGPLPVTEANGLVLRPPYLYLTPWGVGLLFSAPYLLSLFWKRLADRTNLLLWIGVIASAAMVLTYFGVGPYQQAYRYSLDFFPLLFLVFMRSIYHADRRLDVGFKVLIVLTFLLQAHFYLYAVFPGWLG